MDLVLNPVAMMFYNGPEMSECRGLRLGSGGHDSARQSRDIVCHVPNT